MNAIPLVLFLVGATADELSAWKDKLGPDRRIESIDVCHDGTRPRYAAVAVKDDETGTAFISQAKADFLRTYEEQKKAGKRLTGLRIHEERDGPRYTTTWIDDDRDWSNQVGMTSDEYQKLFEERVKLGMRPVHVSGVARDGGHRLSAVFAADRGPGWDATHDRDEKQIVAAVENAIERGSRPERIGAYRSGDRVLYAGIFVGDGRPSVTRLGLTPAQVREQDERLAKSGHRIASLSGVVEKGELRYAVVWIRERARTSRKLPVSGELPAEMRGFDGVMLRFMKERDIPAGTLAVSRGGKMLLMRGYGCIDRDGMKPVAPDTPMRLASLVKPMTAAAVLKLARDGKLKLDARVVELIDFSPAPGQKADPRLKDVTVRHLLDHKGGWDREKSFDPMFRATPIARALDLKRPAGAEDVIRFMAGKPLQFDPGSRESYSNFGYCLLGRIVEKASGATYEQYLRRELLKPLGIASIEQGRTAPEKRNPREPFYSSDLERGRSVFEPDRLNLVPMADAGFHLEAMDAHGGLIGSAPDFARFLEAYTMDGEPRREGMNPSSAFFGSLPGTWTLARQRNDGYVIVAFFNQRSDSTGKKYEPIRAMLDEAADALASK